MLDTHSNDSKSVGLFITCPVDLFRPSVAESVVSVLENCGYEVDVPVQSCCGQVGYNNGDTKQTKQVAIQTATLFEQHDYVVVPSGSCAGMLKVHYLDLFEHDSPHYSLVKSFSEKVYEFTQFLSHVVNPSSLKANCDLSDKTVTYHDSCAGLRELKIQRQPRALLNTMANVSVTEMPDTNVCCGFGGTFCVKFSEISGKMACDKVANARSVNANMLVGGDLSCLLNIAGTIHRQADSDNKPAIEVRHVAELLAGNLDEPGIGDANS